MVLFVKATGTRIMTANEINLYEKLKDFLPGEYTIFSQVCFSVFMTSRDFGTRNQFNRKYADFIILDKYYDIACIVELDDASHRNKEDKDKFRDELCAKVGYRVVRFPSQPNMNQIREKLGFLLPPQEPDAIQAPLNNEPIQPQKPIIPVPVSAVKGDRPNTVERLKP